MDIAYLIAHPEELDQETLYDLRRLVAVYPTYHAARILFLQNLFLLHDPTFDQELRRAALLVPDRRVLFAMTQTIGAPKKTTSTSVSTGEATASKHTAEQVQTSADSKVLVPAKETSAEETPMQEMQDTTTPAIVRGKKNAKKYAVSDTTSQLLDNFLDSTPRPLAKKRIKADPSTDYMSYLMQQEEDETANASNVEPTSGTSRLDSLIDSFIETAEGGIILPEDPMMPEEDPVIETLATEPAETTETATVPAETAEDTEESVTNTPEISPASEEEVEDETDTRVVTNTTELSETLAQIYIKQHRYDRAIEVLSKINSGDAANSNPYLADQMRFLQKLSKLQKSNNQQIK